MQRLIRSPGFFVGRGLLRAPEPRKHPLTFHYTDWLVGTPIVVYCNPNISDSIIPNKSPKQSGSLLSAQKSIPKSHLSKIYLPSHGPRIIGKPMAPKTKSRLQKKNDDVPEQRFLAAPQ